MRGRPRGTPFASSSVRKKKNVVSELTVPLAIARVIGLLHGDAACDRGTIVDRSVTYLALQRGQDRKREERERETEIEIKTGIDRARS